MKKIFFLLILIAAALACSLFAVGAFAEDGESLTDEPALDIIGANLVFSENTHLIFAVNTENVPYGETELLIFKGDGIKAEDCIKGSESETVRTEGKTVTLGGTDGYVFEYSGLMAAELTENIYARAYYKDADGNEYYSRVVKYSVLQYACNKLGMTGTATKDGKLKNLLESLLRYGAAAQESFGVNTDRLATDEYVKYTLEGAVLEDGLSYGLFKKGEVFTATADTSENKPYTMWTDGNGSSVATGESIEVTADRNRTLVARASDSEPTFGSYKYVVIIGVDGAGSFYLDETDTPNIDRIFKDGALTETMRVTSPSASSVSWMSCLHGVPPENHGNLENAVVENGDAYPLNSKYPSVLRVVKETLGGEVACIYSWIGINGIVESGAGINKQRKGDAAIVEYIESGYLTRSKPTLMYLHFNNPDSVGHNIGHHTDEYYASIETIDGYIGRIYDAYEKAGMADDTLFIVTADHGGINKTHGGLNDCEKYCLFAVAGKNVTNTEILDMNIRDTSAVVLHALGVDMPKTYASRVPSGIFGDVTAGERFEYHDEDSPRYRLSEPTPVSGTDGYVDNFVNNDLLLYLPFDGTSDEMLGREVDEFGTLTYEDGYYGQGIRLDDGYLNINDFSFGTGSYTISFFAKSSTPTNGFSPIITNKRASTGYDGFMLAVGRYASVEGYDHYVLLNAAKSGSSVKIQENMPSDYIYGWMHVTVIIDRDNGLLKLSYDFGDFITVDLPSTLGASVSLGTGYSYLTIGEGADGQASYKSGFAIDELMIFEGAFDTEDLRGLADYFGMDIEIEDEESSADVFDDEYKPEVYLGFDGNAGNRGQESVFVCKNGEISYSAGKVGGSAYLDSSHYVGIEGLSLGKDSFSLALWLCATDLSRERGRYIPIASNASASGAGNHGFSVLLDTETEELVVMLGQQGKGAEERVAFSSDYYECRWTHIAVSVDRDRNRLTVYLNFKEVLDTPIYYSGATDAFDATLSIDTSNPIRIGNLGRATSQGSLMAYVDDVMIFGRAIGESDVMRIYDSVKRPLSNYISSSPVIDFGFNGEVADRGDFGGVITEYGDISYSDGKVSWGADITGASVEIPEISLDRNKSFTVSFFVNKDSLRSCGDGELLYVFSNENRSGEGGFFTIAIDRERGGIYVGARGSGGAVGYTFVPYGEAISSGEWLHVAVTVNRSPSENSEYLEVYLNFERADIEVTNLYTFASADFNGDEGATPHIGADGVGSQPCSGKLLIDEFTFFDSALDQSEIAMLKSYYNQ